MSFFLNHPNPSETVKGQRSKVKGFVALQHYPALKPPLSRGSKPTRRSYIMVCSPHQRGGIRFKAYPLPLPKGKGAFDRVPLTFDLKRLR